MILDYQRLTNYDNIHSIMSTAVRTIHYDIQMQFVGNGDGNGVIRV